MPATFFVVNGLDGSNASTRGCALCKGLFSHLSETLILTEALWREGAALQAQKGQFAPLGSCLRSAKLSLCCFATTGRTLLCP